MKVTVSGRTPFASLRLSSRATPPHRRFGLAILLLAGQLFTTPVLAQSSTGDIYGQVAGTTGGSIRIINKETGVTREVPVGAQGRYSAAAIPTGEYHVVLIQDGAEVSSDDVIVKPGVGASVNFGASTTREKATQLSGVTVRGASLNSIDTSSAQTSINFSAKQLQQIPVGQDPVLVALLTPSASLGAPSLSNDPLPTFGGSSVAENSYYINGFNVTNLFRNLSYANVPFEAIQNEQVLTGGYGPEYDLSTGGVINITTKRGSNKWVAGVSGYWDPAVLKGERPDISQQNGQLRRNFDGWSSHDTVTNEWIGGPIIKNKLFFYGLASQNLSSTTQQGYGLGTPNASITAETHAREISPFFLGKVDYNLTDNNLFEYTHIEDKRRTTTQSYNNSYAADGHTIVKGSYLSSDVQKTGGHIDTLKYTGNLTPDLTLSGQWGQLKYSREDSYIASNGQSYQYNGVLGDLNQPGCPFVTDNSANGANNDGVSVASSCSSGATLYPVGRGDFRTNWRADLEYKIELGFLGAHDFKIGYDHDNFKSLDGQISEGGSTYTYNTVPADPQNPTPYDNQNYVEQAIFNTAASARVITTGYYFKDNWKFADRWLAEIGVRSDSFDNRNGAEQSYVKQDNIIQPRLGLVWDVKGDSSMKVFAHYGIYSLPITAGVAIRGASASIYSLQDFYYSGTDPVKGTPVNPTPTPAGGPFYSTPYYLNGENGSTPNPGSVASSNLDPISQSEYILGFQVALAQNWIAGVRGIHRNLDKTIDDDCDLRPVAAYAQRTYGLTVGDNSTSAAPQGVPGCFIINPGSGADLLLPLDSANPSQLYPVHLTAADINEPKAKRVYDAVEFTLEKSFADNWYMNASYTWAHNYGNTEGLVRSDFGQTDTGTTVDFDFPEVMQGSYGRLPNDHRNTFKLFGSYRVVPEFTVSANFQFQTGSPYGCLGTTGNTGPDPYGYQNSYHICNNKIVSEGSVGHTSTITQTDLNFQYRPRYLKGLTASVAVFNVFDEHAVLSVYQTGESASGSSYVATRYAIPSYTFDPYQNPRYIRLGLQYDLPL